jgi:regulatory protein
MTDGSSSAEISKARETVFRMLRMRPRSEKELRDKLKLKEFSDDTIDATIEYLKKIRLIDDQQFARAWINSRLSRPFGLKRIQFELQNKGVSKNIIQQQFDTVKETYEEKEVVVELAKRRYARYKNIDTTKAKRRVFDYLARRGFSAEAINTAMRELK